MGVERINNHLQKTGLLVLDAHLNFLDILLTARYFYRKHSVSIIMPIAGYVFYVPLMKNVVNWFARRYKIKFFPVYRKEELKPTNLLMKLMCSFYPDSINYPIRRKANDFFVKTAISTCKKSSHVAIVAPYGSPLWFGKNIKNGVLKIILSEVNFAVSRSEWSWRKLNFEVKIGQISQLQSASKPENIEGLLKNKFKLIL